MCDCDVGTARDIVAEPALVDMTRPEDLAQLREKMIEYARKLNAHQRSLVCLCQQLDAQLTRIQAGGTSVTALGVRVVALEGLVATLNSQMASVDNHVHTLTVGTTGGGEAVSLVGGASGTLNTTSGGVAETDAFVLP